MPTFFTNQDGKAPIGRVVQIVDDHSQGTLQFTRIKDNNITFASHRSIITRMTLGHQCNTQFLHTIGNEIYIYVFGDRIGQVTLSGISFAADCNGARTHGFEEVLRWYEQYRVAAQRDPVKVMIGQTGMNGFVVGLNGDVIDPAMRLMQWSLTLMVLPGKGNS